MVHCCRVILHLCTCSLGISPFMHHLITSLELIVLRWEIQQSSNKWPNKKWLYSAWRLLIKHESDFGLLFRAYVKVIHSTSKVNVPQYLARVPNTAKAPPTLKHIAGVNMSIFAAIFIPLMAGSNNSAKFGNLNLQLNALIQNRTSSDNPQTNVSTFSKTSCYNIKGKPNTLMRNSIFKAFHAYLAHSAKWSLEFTLSPFFPV